MTHFISRKMLPLFLLLFFQASLTLAADSEPTLGLGDGTGGEGVALGVASDFIGNVDISVGGPTIAILFNDDGEGSNIDIGARFGITYSISNATFSEAFSVADLSLTIGESSDVAISIQSGGAVGDSSVTYLVDVVGAMAGPSEMLELVIGDIEIISTGQDVSASASILLHFTSGLDDPIEGAVDDSLGSGGETEITIVSRIDANAGDIELSDLNGQRGSVIKGIDVDDYSGYSVSDAGDVNADGYADFIIGAYQAAGPGGFNETGEVYLVLGKSTWVDSLELGNSGASVVVLRGIDAGDYTGISVSNAGDVNGDGYDDILIGANHADPNGNVSAGESYLVFGKATWGAALDLGNDDGSVVVLNGIDEVDNSGLSVSGAGDINGDGYDDFLIGAYLGDPNGDSNAGESYLVFGKSSWGSSLELDINDGGVVTIKGIDPIDRSGISVSAAGDVDGDGYSDLLIGADAADPGGENGAGESYLVFGKPSWGNEFELDSSNSDLVTIRGVNAFDRSGASVSKAGDVNADGYADILIGANFADPNGNVNAGAAYLVFGRASWASSLDLEHVSGSVVVLNGIDDGDNAGVSVSDAGDVNADGFDDILVGANHANESYLVFGASDLDGEIDLDSSDGSVIAIRGVESWDQSGISVSSAGDVNDDGYADFIIGAYLADPNGISNAGESYLLFGFSTDQVDSDNDNYPDAVEISEGSDPLDSESTPLDTDGDFEPNSTDEDDDNDGISDTNDAFPLDALEDSDTDEDGIGNNADTDDDGDGYLDTVEVSEGFDPFDADSRPLDADSDFDPDSTDLDDDNDGYLDTVELAEGSNPKNSASKPLDSDRDFIPNSTDSDDDNDGILDGSDVFPLLRGEWVDTDGDGVGDNSDRYPLDASEWSDANGNDIPDNEEELISEISLSNLLGSNGFVLTGISPGDFSGISVSGAGDINNDGYSDFLIGASGALSNIGESYLIFGKENWGANLLLDDLDGDIGVVFRGIDSSDQSGIWVSILGDANGDGFDDFIIGAPFAFPNGLPLAGESYLIYGSSDSWSSHFSLSSLDGSNGVVINGADPVGVSGIPVSGAGDVNGDGFDDFLVSALLAGPSGKINAGKGYLVFGKPSDGIQSLDLEGLDGVNGVRFDGINPGDELGRGISAVGDINGDGYSDFAIGAINADPEGKEDAGESYLIFGKPTGWGASMDLSMLDGLNGFSIEGVAMGDKSGQGISAAGDINGDGFDDFIIGAYEADPNGHAGAGESYLVFGKGTVWASSLNLESLDGSNGLTFKGTNVGDQSGFYVSGIGDFNGDGYDDLIIGSIQLDIEGKGESYIIFGKPSGWNASFELDSLNGVSGIKITGVSDGDMSGAVSAAGDVNGDGYDDVIIGARGVDINLDENVGSSYVVFGFKTQLDADGDGFADGGDAFPLDPTENADVDNDGMGDNADLDDDNDGTPDIDDDFPFDALEDRDTDGDGIGNNADTDDDGDGFLDSDELASGSDPLDPASFPIAEVIDLPSWNRGWRLAIP